MAKDDVVEVALADGAEHIHFRDTSPRHLPSSLPSSQAVAKNDAHLVESLRGRAEGG